MFSGGSSLGSNVALRSQLKGSLVNFIENLKSSRPLRRSCEGLPCAHRDFERDRNKLDPLDTSVSFFSTFFCQAGRAMSDHLDMQLRC